MQSFYFAIAISGPKVMQKVTLHDLQSPLEFFQGIIEGFIIECFLPGVTGSVGVRFDGWSTLIVCESPGDSIGDNLNLNCKLSKTIEFLVANFGNASIFVASEAAFDDFVELHDFDWIRDKDSFSVFSNWVMQNKEKFEWHINS